MLAEQAFLSLPFPEGKPEETNDEEEEKEEEDGDGDLEEDFNDIVQQLLQKSALTPNILHGCEKNSGSEILAVLKQPLSVLVDT